MCHLLETRDTETLRQLMLDDPELLARFNHSKPDGGRMTPLMVAARHRDVLMVDMLLCMLSGSIEAKDGSGGTVLHQMCASQQADMAQWLALRGADISALNNVSSLTPFCQTDVSSS